MRLFIAINFDDVTKKNILSVQERIQNAGKGNFSRPENLHLTLAFLGEVASVRTDAVHRAMDGTAVNPMALRFDHVDCFKRDSGDLWWIGIHKNRALTTLQQRLSKNLQSEGFLLESRRFSPHITLARNVQLREQPDCKFLLSKPFTACANRVSLMLSQRVNGKLTYTEQYSITAAPEPQKGEQCP